MREIDLRISAGGSMKTCKLLWIWSGGNLSLSGITHDSPNSAETAYEQAFSDPVA